MGSDAGEDIICRWRRICYPLHQLYIDKEREQTVGPLIKASKSVWGWGWLFTVGLLDMVRGEDESEGLVGCAFKCNQRYK
jgi:hypothetical protein